MRNDIKTKVKNNVIKQKQGKNQLTHYIKNTTISAKEEKEDNTQGTKANAQRNAVNNVEQSIKFTAFKTYQKTKATIDNYITKTSINTKNKILYNNQRSYISKHSINEQYNDKMQSVVYKKRNYNKVNNISSKISKKIVDRLSTIYISTISFIKQTVSSVGTIIYLGTSALLLIVITLFIGVFASLSDNSVYSPSLAPLSDEVIAYTSTITEYAKKYELEKYVDLIQSIMMVESKGLSNDPMDSGRFINQTIDNPSYSIEIGVKYLANCLNKANVTSPNNTEQLYLAIQGYDFKDEYILWALRNFDGYSTSNVKLYYDLKQNEANNLFEGNYNYVEHVTKYYKSRGRIVEIAKSQIGNLGGMKYWKWYGFKDRVEWCACFISWCANESGDLNISIPKFSSVDNGMQWYKNKGLLFDKNYIPSPGDIVFFDWDNDNNPDHVGIVEKLEHNVLYTIEGNSNDKCKNKKYNSYSNVIIGYGKS